jgi:hypothetical protein
MNRKQKLECGLLIFQPRGQVEAEYFDDEQDNEVLNNKSIVSIPDLKYQLQESFRMIVILLFKR